MINSISVEQNISGNFTIEDALNTDFETINDISDAEFGENYFSVPYSLKKHNNSFIRVVRNKNNVIGFSFCYLELAKKIKATIPISNNFINDLSLIGVIKTVALHRNYKGKGIGTQLMNDSISILKSVNAQYLLSVLWKYDGAVKVERILRNNGFMFLCEVNNYWKRDSIIRKYICPVCGNPCNCSALMYLQRVE
ncbi:MAG: GNAT family N-acetyltransferase [Marinilabiliaceae bacterium]|nr:GNAT family N-acetyltransferase [Marinilabiliaceae bacterium]